MKLPGNVVDDCSSKISQINNLAVAQKIGSILNSYNASSGPLLLLQEAMMKVTSNLRTYNSRHFQRATVIETRLVVRIIKFLRIYVCVPFFSSCLICCIQNREPHGRTILSFKNRGFCKGAGDVPLKPNQI